MKLSEIKEQSEARPPQAVAPEITDLEKVLHISFELQNQQLDATVTTRILTLEQSLRRDRALVQLSAPEKYDDLPAMAKLRIYALATLSQALLDPPAWLDEWIGRYDPLLFAVFEEVSAHERAFFRGHMAEGETEESPTVRVKSFSAPTP